MRDFSKPRVTTRAVIDHSRKCVLRCRQCYYRVTDDFYSVDSWESVSAEVMKAVDRKCTSVEVTGGEPLQADEWIVDLVKLCVQVNLPPRIITSLICKESTLDAVLDAGVDDFLISMHGAKDETHNEVVQIPRARYFQKRRLAKIAQRMDYCLNYCVLGYTETEIVEFAKWAIDPGHRPPKVLNYIAFNGFNPWVVSGEQWKDEAKKNCADIRVAGPQLDEAIDLLEAAGIGVNVRYFPYCGLSERHFNNICNDLHVWADEGEWDNSIPQVGGRTIEQGEAYGHSISAHNELQTEPCSTCGLKQICGGANRIWHQLALEKFGVETLTQIATPAGVDPSMPYWHYRKDNVLGLDPRRPQSEAVETV